MFFGRKAQLLTAFLSLCLCFGAVTLAEPNFYVRKKLLPEAPVNANSSTTPQAASSPAESDLQPRRVIPGPPPKAPGKPLKPPVIENIKVENPKIESQPKATVAPSLKPAFPQSASIKTQTPLRIDVESNTVKPSPNPVPLKASAKKTDVMSQKPTSPKVTSPQIIPKQKPLVHFPEELMGESINHSQQTLQTKNATPYPRRYKPLLSPINPQQADWHQQAIAAYELGNSLGQQGRVDEAMAAYQKALKMAPNFADAYVGLSTAAILKGQWETALNSADKGLSLRSGFTDPSNITRAYYNLSATYCVMDHYSQAKRYYQKVQTARYPLAPQLWSYIQQNCKH